MNIDVGHSRLYPYAVRLAKEQGAKEVFIEAKIGGIVNPDVLGIRDVQGTPLFDLRSWNRIVDDSTRGKPKPLVVVQCEVSTGPKTTPERFRKHSEIAPVADFFYILDGFADARHVRRHIEEEIPTARVFSFTELVERYGHLQIGHESLP